MTRYRHLLLGSLAALALIATAVATEADKVIYPGATAQSAPSTPGLAGGSTLSIVAILLLLAAGGWILWRCRGKVLPGRDTPQLAIAETRSLGNRQYLVVASYEGRKFLLGVCPGRIDLLAPLDAPADPRKSP